MIEDPAAILGAIEEGREDVRRRGLEPLVGARFPLFIIRDGKRHYLAPDASGALVAGDGTSFSKSQLRRLLDDDPRVFSSGALLRPLVQQYALPCVLTIGGPAEVGYFAQSAPVARQLGVAPPPIGLRLDATLLEGKLARTAREIGAEILATARSPEDLLPVNRQQDYRTG